MTIMFGNDSLIHQPKSSNKQMINDSGSDIHMDSGYASAASISYNQTVASASSSMKKSLEPIAENYESTFNEASSASNIETPTTRSTRQLSEFHIQTPQNDKRIMETTPTKAKNPLRPSQKSSTKKNRSTVWSPYKGTPNKRNDSGTNYPSMHVSFTDKMKSAEQHKHYGLYDSTDNDNENIENNFEISVNEPSFSPIDHHNKSLISEVPILSGRTLQRHPSGIESSTPITRPMKHTHTQTVAKTQFDSENAMDAKFLLRKTQSFPAHRVSPVKRVTILQEISTNSPAKLVRHDELLEEDEVVPIREPNPARKMLAFSSNQFNSLLTGGLVDVSELAPAESSAKPQKTLTKPVATRRTSTFQRQRRIELSPPPTIASPTRNDMVKQSIQEEAMRCPKKKLQRSTSYNPASPKGNHIEKTQLKTSVDCTPPKLYRRKPLKRPATNSIGDESTTIDDITEPPAKRKLHYVGLERMDILTRLEGADNVHGLILSKLINEDLHAANRVCRSWSQIIARDKTSHSRLLKYTRELERAKENANRSKNNRIEPGPSQAKNFQRKPFARRNNSYQLRPSPRKSPPVSPSSRKFRENQKVSTDISFSLFHSHSPIITFHVYSLPILCGICFYNQVVKKLKPGQKVRKCPRCNSSSIVYTASEPLPSTPSPRKLKPNLLFSRHKGYSLPMPSTSNTAVAASARAWKSIDGHKKADPVVSEYAECSWLPCGYSFCTYCNCERHVDSVCPRQSLSSSPSSDDDVCVRPRSRRSALRRL